MDPIPWFPTLEDLLCLTLRRIEAFGIIKKMTQIEAFGEVVNYAQLGCLAEFKLLKQVVLQLDVALKLVQDEAAEQGAGRAQPAAAAVAAGLHAL